MKVALLISGYLRTLEYNIANIKEKILNVFDNVDVYMHITSTEKIADKYYNKDVSDSFIQDNLNPLVCLKEDNYKFTSNVLENNVYNTWFKYYKLNLLKQENEKTFGKYDLVIKYRPDLHITSDNLFANLSNKSIYLPGESLIDRAKLKNPSDPFVCDIFAYGRSEQMDSYFSIFNNLKLLIAQYGHVSETLLYYYLNGHHIDYVEESIQYTMLLSQCNAFAICGDSGSGKSTLSNMLKKYFSNSFTLECDRYHKWERGDEKWNNMTHLNPNANFITKMSKDIFDLKLGKTIYQADYDHVTGKFTDKKQIKSSNNIIVCGLHSLYSDSCLYNLKIYMDTDEQLRCFWKIKRDTLIRGHSRENVINQIKKREADYKKYIQPQKVNADLIINFYPRQNIDWDDLTQDPNVGLRIIVNKNINWGHTISVLENHRVGFKKTTTEKGHVFDFPAFVPLKDNKHLHFKVDNFYDYIMMFVLNSY
jgi:uridine kinase